MPQKGTKSTKIRFQGIGNIKKNYKMNNISRLYRNTSVYKLSGVSTIIWGTNARSEYNSSREKNDNRGTGFPQILHDRSRDTGFQLFKLLISLSTATLAIYFFALTGEAKPPLTTIQQIIAFLALIFMALAVFGGIVSMHCDSRRNYYWACALQTKDKYKKRRIKKKRIFGLNWSIEHISYLLYVFVLEYFAL